MQINKISGNWLKTFEITKKRSFNGKNGKSNFFIIIFLPTLLHDLAASRQVKIGTLNNSCASRIQEIQ